MILTDTHTHLYYPSETATTAQLMERCLDNNVTRLFLPNVDLESVGMIDSLVERYPEHCFAMLGLHPCSVTAGYAQHLTRLHELASNRTLYAIGEIGIDLYWDKSTLAWQQDAFRRQIDWAKAEDLPIVIHCREAFDEVFEILEELNDDKLRGIFHCFSGSSEQAQKVIDLGFYLGIGGVVTYKKAGLDTVVRDIDLKHIVLETDSPYLTPVPYRGKPNESSYLVYIAAKIAEIKGITIEEVAEITTENSKLIFGV